MKRSPIKNRRTKPRPGRLQGAELEELREKRWELDDRSCVICGKYIYLKAPQESDNSMHLAHRKGKRMWGDSIENTQTECGACHRAYHHNGPSRTKIVPAKERTL